MMAETSVRRCLPFGQCEDSAVRRWLQRKPKRYRPPVLAVSTRTAHTLVMTTEGRRSRGLIGVIIKQNLLALDTAQPADPSYTAK